MTIDSVHIKSKPFAPFNATLREALSSLKAFKDEYACPNVLFKLQSWNEPNHMWQDECQTISLDRFVRRFRLVKITYYVDEL